jgi:hypothetical protein
VTAGGGDADLGRSAPTVGMSIGEAGPCSERQGQRSATGAVHEGHGEVDPLHFTMVWWLLYDCSRYRWR